MIPPASVLNEAQARDQIVAYLVDTHDLSFSGEWTDQGVSPSAGDRASRVFTSGPWVVEVEYAPAAPLVSSYHVTVDNLTEELRWEGDISARGAILETSFSG
jgi:hypothetical protein